jgi:hypothetical protein
MKQLNFNFRLTNQESHSSSELNTQWHGKIVFFLRNDNQVCGSACFLDFWLKNAE